MPIQVQEASRIPNRLDHNRTTTIMVKLLDHNRTYYYYDNRTIINTTSTENRERKLKAVR
jgi:hypothetical protein